MDRRDLLRAAGISLAAISLGAVSKRAKLGTVIGPGFYLDADSGQKSFVLALVDLDAGVKKRVRREIPLSFFAHGVTPNPARPHTAVLFEKKGPGACEIDLVAKKVLRPITTAPDRRFYGHGAFSADASLLYATESVVGDNYRGVITVRDAKTFETRGLFPTYGAAPHDCRLIDGGKVLAITNGGGDINGGAPPSVTYVDVASEKLLDQVELGTPRVNAGHLAITRGGDLAVVSAPRDGLPNQANERGAISLRPKGRVLQTLSEPAEITARMVGETLSLAVHEPTGVVAATNPTGHLVTFWELKTGRLVKYLDYPHPRGVALTLDGKNFVVSYAPESKLILLDAATLVADEASKFEPSYMSGSHIITYALPA